MHFKLWISYRSHINSCSFFVALINRQTSLIEPYNNIENRIPNISIAYIKVLDLFLPMPVQTGKFLKKFYTVTRLGNIGARYPKFGIYALGIGFCIFYCNFVKYYSYLDTRYGGL